MLNETHKLRESAEQHVTRNGKRMKRKTLTEIFQIFLTFIVEFGRLSQTFTEYAAIS